MSSQTIIKKIISYVLTDSYARYSDSAQREESIEGQLRECGEFAERKGFTVIKTYAEACDIIEPTQESLIYQGFQRVGHFIENYITQPGLTSHT